MTECVSLSKSTEAADMLTEEHGDLKLFDAHCHLQVGRSPSAPVFQTQVINDQSARMERHATSVLRGDIGSSTQDARYGSRSVEVFNRSCANGIEHLAVCGTSERDWAAVGIMFNMHHTILYLAR